MTFREFWPLYLEAHRRPGTRALHYCATLVGLGSALLALVAFEPLFLAGIAPAYAIAIGAHALVEKNRPMIGVNPVWGAVADLKMFWLALTGRLGGEFRRQQHRETGASGFRR